ALAVGEVEASSGGQPIAADLFALVVAVGSTALLAAVLDSWLFGIPGLVFAVLVLFWCLHPRHLHPHLDAYLVARAGHDDNAARREAQYLLDEPIPVDTEEEVRKVADSVLIGGLTEVFAVLFWFVLLGPAGAVLYRCAWALGHQPAEAAAPTEAGTVQTIPAAPLAPGWRQRVLAVLEWLPARMMAALFLLVGAYEKGARAWQQAAAVSAEQPGQDRWLAGSRNLLRDVGRGAIEAEAQVVCERDSNDCLVTRAGLVTSARAVVFRATVAGIAVVALATLAGWLA
ncbi:MAG: regulatory signaling modulator protein AmpE, partial [Halothiobacillaceae bacterium]